VAALTTLCLIAVGAQAGSHNNANFSFSTDRAGATWECRIDGGTWGACGSPKSYTGLSAGSHTFEARATFNVQAESTPNAVTHEAESFTLTSGSGKINYDGSASGGRELLIWSNAVANKYITLDGSASKVTLRARGQLCGTAAPRVEIRSNGTAVGAVSVTGTSLANYSANVNIPAGTHQIGLAFTNDYYVGGCDRNVHIDWIRFDGTKELTQPPPDANPLAGASFYVDSNSHAAQQASQWRTSRPADAVQMEKIAAQPRSFWTGDDTPTQVQTHVNNIVSTAASQGKVPVLMTYNIPSRDCGSYSSGGASGADAYKAWIQAFANGIGDRKAVVIVEPVAIPAMDCLSAMDRQLYLKLVGFAVDTLRAKPNTYVYIDAGHSAWQPVVTMVDRLKAAGIARAHGFSLNVSNFQTTASNVTYGTQISQGVGGKHFVIDTSRQRPRGLLQ
jgi:endoglucanase